MYIAQVFKAKTDWWRYLIGIIIIFIAWQVIGVIPLVATAFLKAGNVGDFIAAAENSFMQMGLDPNLFLSLMIFSFACGLLGIWIVVKYIHEQKFKDLTTTRSKVDWGRIKFAFVMVFSINLLLFAIGYLLEPEVLQWNFQPVPFLILFVIVILFLPFQTSFEEYLMRGYLMQGLGGLAKNKWFPFFVTSVIFGLLHSFNPEVEKLGPIIMIFYIGTGVVLGLITLMDEGLELALGFHAANNIFIALMVTSDWTAFQVPSLFLDTSEPTAGFDVIAPVFILYPLYIFILSKKYGWSDWKNKLFGKVEKPETIKLSEES